MPDSSLTDDYHCFVVDLGLTAPGVATGYRITPGNAKIVHHVITTLFDASSKAALDAYDAASSVPGSRSSPVNGRPTISSACCARSCGERAHAASSRR